MLKLCIIADQIGSPTYAIDLAGAILYIIESKKEEFGVYHYSNEGTISWFDLPKLFLTSAKLPLK